MMNNLSVVLPKLLSDLLINLSAGFLGAALIIPITFTSDEVRKIRVTLLITNVLVACLLFASAVIINI